MISPRALIYYVYSLAEMLTHFKNWPNLLPYLLRRPGSGTVKLEVRRPHIEVLVRGAMDIWSVKETLLDQFYSRYGVPVQEGWSVIDIGAGIGDYCLHAAYGNAGVNMVAFEPFPGSYSLLQQNLVLNGLESIRTYQKAVWGSNGTLKLNLDTGEPLQFISQEISTSDNGDNYLMVDALSLEAVLTSELLEEVDLLKMDCEGAEYEILLNAPTKVLERIKRIIMEYHNIDDEHHHQMLVAFLEKQGYRVTCYQNFVHQHIGYLFADRI